MVKTETIYIKKINKGGIKLDRNGCSFLNMRYVGNRRRFRGCKRLGSPFTLHGGERFQPGNRLPFPFCDVVKCINDEHFVYVSAN